MPQVIWILAVTLLLAAGGLTQAAPVRAAAWDAPAVVVNGVKITRGHVARFLLETMGRDWLKGMVGKEVLLREAKAKGVACAAKELEQEIRGIVGKVLAAQARGQGMTPDEYRRRLRAEGKRAEAVTPAERKALAEPARLDVLFRKLLRSEIKVSEADVRKAWRQRHGPRIRVRHIELASLAKAMEAFRALERGADFAGLARELSLDKKSKARGFEMVPPPTPKSSVGRRALGMKPGQRAIVREGGRYHVIEFLGRATAASKPYATAAPAIRAELIQEQVDSRRDSYLDHLMERHGAAILFDTAPARWDAVVARIRERKIRRGELAEVLMRELASSNLNALIVQEAVRQEAARRRVSVSERELARYMAPHVERLLAAQAQRNGLADLEAYDRYLAAKGSSLAERRRSVRLSWAPTMRARLLAEKCLMGILKVSPEEVGTEFRRRYAAKTQARQIVSASREQLERMSTALAKGADFARLARQFSRDAVSRKRGGLLEVRGEGALGRALLSMKTGERRILRVGRWWHLVEKVAAIPAKRARLENVRDRIRQDLIARKARRERGLWIMDLQAKTKVKVYLD